VRELDIDEADISAVNLSPDGSRAVTYGDRGLRLWDVATGGEVANLFHSSYGFPLIGFSPDGLLAFAVHERAVLFWDAVTGNRLPAGLGHEQLITDVVFDRTGSRLVTASIDGTVEVWNFGLETRAPAEIAALLRCRFPWRLLDGRPVAAQPDQSACDRYRRLRGQRRGSYP
jgi:WD40 repeat protein